MAATFQHKQYSPGEVIFRKGETGTFLYLAEHEVPARREGGDHEDDGVLALRRVRPAHRQVVERVGHLAAPSRVREGLGMLQMNERLARSAGRVHRATPPPDRWPPSDSERYRNVRRSFYPIARPRHSGLRPGIVAILYEDSAFRVRSGW